MELWVLQYPLLETPSKQVVMESTAIVKFLADRTPLYPQPHDPRSLRRAHIDMWTDWALQFQPIVTALAHPILGAPHQRSSHQTSRTAIALQTLL